MLLPHTVGITSDIRVDNSASLETYGSMEAGMWLVVSTGPLLTLTQPCMVRVCSQAHELGTSDNLFIPEANTNDPR